MQEGPNAIPDTNDPATKPDEGGATWAPPAAPGEEKPEGGDAGGDMPEEKKPGGM